jgi:hypothetical protein
MDSSGPISAPEGCERSCNASSALMTPLVTIRLSNLSITAGGATPITGAGSGETAAVELGPFGDPAKHVPRRPQNQDNE